MATPTNSIVTLQALRTEMLNMQENLSVLIATVDQEIIRRIDAPTTEIPEPECECNGVNRDGCPVCRAVAARIYGAEFEE